MPSFSPAKLLEVSSVALAGYERASRSRGVEGAVTHMHFVAFNCEFLANW
jgi:hypothetical protein